MIVVNDIYDIDLLLCSTNSFYNGGLEAVSYS